VFSKQLVKNIVLHTRANANSKETINKLHVPQEVQ